jgi:hypothetical protein
LFSGSGAVSQTGQVETEDNSQVEAPDEEVEVNPTGEERKACSRIASTTSFDRMNGIGALEQQLGSEFPARKARPSMSSEASSEANVISKPSGLAFAFDNVAPEEFPSFVKKNDSSLTFPEKVEKNYSGHCM